MGQTSHSKDGAYKLKDVSAHREYYDEWAESYDTGFVEEVGYIYPQVVGQRFIELAAAGDSPVADLGCGTGLAGRAFAGTGFEIDGFDVSEGMLEQARAKGFYRDLRVADLTRQEGLPVRKFGGLISCGTFTLGHLGPADLEVSLVMARANALCVIGVNASHYREQGFASHLQSLNDKNMISGFRAEEVQIYENEDNSESINRALLVIFRVI